MTLKIYGVSRSRARRNIWLALELGAAYTQIPVIQAHRLANPDAPGAPLNTRSPEFLEINPNGRIPAMDDDGFRLCESMAINLYLARKHGGPLAPSNGKEESLAEMWALWAAIECEPHGILVQRHRQTNPPEKRDTALAAEAVAALRKPFAVLDKALAKDGFVMGGRFTVADINVASIVSYTVLAPELFDDAPNVKAWLDACNARPAWKKMMAMFNAEPA